MGQLLALHDGSLDVRMVETHASWVFLTARSAWKRKKIPPLALPSEIAQDPGRRLCEEELRLNQRLSPSVYLGVVPLFRSPHGELQLAPEGEPADWLLHMRRLPDERSLEALLRSTGVSPREMDGLGRTIADFHARCQPIALAPAVYRSRLLRSIKADRKALLHLHYRLPRAAVEHLFCLLHGEARRLSPQLAGRVRDGHVIEGHGDLRAEHVYLTEPIEIIDCLDFSQVLRTQDGADEAGFLALECERFGARSAARRLLHGYLRARHDAISQQLLNFYQACRACTRARLALAHLDEARYRYQKRWRLRALDYLALAAAHSARHPRSHGYGLRLAAPGRAEGRPRPRPRRTATVWPRAQPGAA